MRKIIKKSNLRPLLSNLILGITLLTPLPLIAQENRDLPIDITSQEVIFEQSQNLVIYEKEVVMTQGILEIRANRAEFLIDDGEAHDLTAMGNVRIHYRPAQQSNWIDATAAKLQYLPAKSLLRLSGNAKVTQQGDTMSADRIDYHLDTAQIRALGEKGKNIHFRIHPKRKD